MTEKATFHSSVSGVTPAGLWLHLQPAQVLSSEHIRKRETKTVNKDTVHVMSLTLSVGI